MGTKKNDTATASTNPNNASARGLYEAVVTKEGTVDGKAARIALYGTRYAACEVAATDGSWSIVQDVAFGGIRGISMLKTYLDDAAPAPAPAVDAVAVIAESPVVVSVPVEEPAPVVTEPATPTYATLDEVRAAYEAETRGACRASVLRALRVRAGEIALGVEPGSKAKAASAPKADGGERTRTQRMSLAEMLEKGIVKLGDEVRLRTKPDVVTTIAANALTADGRNFNRWATDETGTKALNVYVNAIHVPTGKLLDDLRG